MSTNRIIYVLVVLTLLLVTFLTFQQAASAGAIRRAGQFGNQTAQRQDAMLRGHRGGMKLDLSGNWRTTPAAGDNEP